MKKLLVVLAMFAVGCSSYDLVTPTQESLAGKWNLTSVNGSSLPYIASHVGSNSQAVTADVLTLTAPNTFTDVTTLQVTQNGQVTTQTITDSGTYQFNSYAVLFTFHSTGEVGSGTLTGQTMKIITSGVTFIYKKGN